MKNDYKFDVKIPYCKQLDKTKDQKTKKSNKNKDQDDESDDSDIEKNKLKDKTLIEKAKDTKIDQPLTALQASESRLVTKIRFQVERVNGKLKQH